MRSVLVGAMLFSVVLNSSVSGAEPMRLPPAVDLRGRIQSLEQNDRRLIRVFVFLSTDCPISRSYLPELNRLAKEWTRPDSRVELFGVWMDATVTRVAATQLFENEFKVAFPVLHDSASLLARTFQPTRIPEAFVLDADGRLVYRGAIDNAWEDIGRRRPRAEMTFLADAVRATVDGKPVPVAQTKAVGCLFESRVEANGKDATVTFARDIAPIIFTRCMNCHRSGQVAPFSLTNHAEVAKHAKMIVEVTQRRIMPPWMPAGSKADVPARPSAGEQPRFVGERWLSDRELELLKVWSEYGCAEGDLNDLPAMPEFVESWRLGEPDLIVKKPVAESLNQPANLVGSIWTANYEMDIPASEKNYRRTTSCVLPKEVIMVGIVPHMHLLGKTMKVTATLPRSHARQSVGEPQENSISGRQSANAPAHVLANAATTLIDVPAWNYNWQDEYYYERPFKLPAGTRITVEATFDNLANDAKQPRAKVEAKP